MSVSYISLEQETGNREKLNSMDNKKNDSEMLISYTSESAPNSKSGPNDNLDNRGNLSPLHTEIENTSNETIDINHASVSGVVVTNPKNENESTNLIPPSLTLGSEKKGDHDNEIPHDDNRPYSPYYPANERPRFPTPGFGFDNEIGSTLGTEIPDVNIYQHKKTLAQGMMDLALFSANANQLRYVLESFARHPFYYPSVILISLSLLLQVAIGVGLIWNATYNVKDDKEICIANKINNFTVIAIFLVTVINVFISAFGVADPA